MEKVRFYNKINEFLAHNFILVLIFLFIFFSISYQYKSVFNNESSVIKNRNSIIGRNYSLDTTDGAVYMKNTAYSVRATSNEINMKTSDINQQNTQGRKIVKNFNLVIIVKDVAEAKNDVEKELEKYSGYTSNFYSYEYSNKKAINIELKVPSEKVDEYLEIVKKNGYTKSESFSSVDYTEQYNDNENKLKNLYTRRDKLRNMMEMKAEKLADLLAVDKELNNTQLEIERLEKRNTKIQNDVDFSSVNITLEPEIVENKENMQWNIKKVFVNAVDLLISFYHIVVEYIIILLVFLPVVIIIGIVFFTTKKIYTIIKNKKK